MSGKHKNKKIPPKKADQQKQSEEASKGKEALPEEIHTEDKKEASQEQGLPVGPAAESQKDNPQEQDSTISPGTESSADSPQEQDSSISPVSESQTDSPQEQDSAISNSSEPQEEKHEEEAPKDTSEAKGTKRIFGLKLTSNHILQILRYLCIIGFVIFLGLFINETFIQPYRTKKVIDYTRDLYHRPVEDDVKEATPTPTLPPTPIPVPVDAGVTPIPVPTVTEAPTPTPDPNRDEQGRLLQFQDLLAMNEDTKGWITIPDTNIDYVVVQSPKEDPEYYLFKGFDREYNKAGTLFLDARSSVEKKTKNLVIHGHNMVSTKEKMFHSILEYKKDINFFREHPIIQFDTIYQTGNWKVFAVFITPPDPANEDFFEFRRSSFKNSSEFLNFIYQIRIRSLVNVDVDINENDELLTLSTCSYEVNDDYRTIVVARKVREGEDITVDAQSIKTNKKPYYAKDYRELHGKKIPDVAPTFEEALELGQITWYTPVDDTTNVESAVIP